MQMLPVSMVLADSKFNIRGQEDGQIESQWRMLPNANGRANVRCELGPEEREIPNACAFATTAPVAMVMPQLRRTMHPNTTKGQVMRIARLFLRTTKARFTLKL
jgi:hypothetical protein